ncbi:MAG: TolC family protein [Myxococcales bacterium]|nr:TolC family protein [Myxococcales bacterium]
MTLSFVVPAAADPPGAADAAVNDAAPGDRFGRADAVAAMARTNPEVARAIAAIDRARIEADSELGVLDPLVSAQLDLSHARTPTNAGLSSGIAVNDRYSLSTGIGRTFAPGTQLQFTLSQSVTRSVFPFSTGLGFGDQRIVSGPNYETELVLRATQPLLRGFGARATLARRDLALRLARVRDAEALGVLSRKTLEVLVAYAELQYAGDELVLRQRSVERTQRQLEIARAEVEAGQIAPIELDRIHEQLFARHEAVVVAGAEVRRRERALQELIGADPATLGRLGALDEPLEVPDDVVFRAAYCDEAAHASPEVAALNAQRRVAERQVDVARDAARPSLDLTTGLTQSGLGETWGEGLEQAVTLEAPTLFVGAVFSSPLRNRAARGAVAVARHDIDAIDAEADAAGTALCYRVHDATDALVLLRERDAIAADREELARRAVEAEQERFVSGLSTVQAGLDALELLEVAEIGRRRVAADVETAWLQLAQLRGTLLESYVGVVDGFGAP